jgi:single-strand DNA-binding protein
MANFNKVMLMGNLTRDPQLSYTPSQTAVTDFGLAVNRRWTGRDGSKKEEACFVDCTSFGKTAETINKYMTKGRPIFVEGRLSFSSWVGQDGGKRSKLKVIVENFQFLGAGQRAAAVGAEGESYGEPDSGASQAGEQNAADDDIPF